MGNKWLPRFVAVASGTAVAFDAPRERHLRQRANRGGVPSRRSLLTTTASLVATTGLSGCPSALGTDPEQHYVDMLNGTDEPHVFAVTVTDAAGETLFEHEYDLGAGTGDENRIVDGTPARVAVAVDDGEPVQFPWAPLEGPSFTGTDPDGCSAATSTSLTIWYGLQSEAAVETVYGCETVREA